MATIKFYQDANGVFYFGSRTASPGSIQIVKVSDTHLNFQFENGKDFFNEDLTPEQVLDAEGNATYTSYDDIVAKNRNFFVKASEAALWDAISEAQHAYGVLLDNNFSSPLVTRIGNLELHKTLPVHSNMKGCLLLDDGTVNYYLKPTDWTKKLDETASVLDGTDGQVRYLPIIAASRWWIVCASRCLFPNRLLPDIHLCQSIIFRLIKQYCNDQTQNLAR